MRLLLAIVAALLLAFGGATSVAMADDVILESAKDSDAPSQPVVQVLKNPTLGTITIDNPPNAAPLPPQCIQSPGSSTWICLGTSPREIQDGSWQQNGVQIMGGDRYEGFGVGLGSAIDEAVTTIMARHDLVDRDMVYAYARPEIRAYLHARFTDLLDRALYGQPMSASDQALYERLTQLVLNEERDNARQAVQEYRRWQQDPCGYEPPRPPADSGLPYYPNPTAETQACKGAHPLTQAWRISNNTPTVEEFQTWASYAHPTPSMKVAGDPTLARSLKDTMTAATMLAGAGSAAIGATLAGSIVGSSASLASAFMASVIGSTAAAHGISNAMAIACGVAPAAALVGIVVAAGAILATAAWQMADDLEIPQKLFARADQAEMASDPFGIEALRPYYQSLNYETREVHSDPALFPPHRMPEVQALLIKRIAEWTMFTETGEFVPDPLAGYNEEPAPTDIKFRLGTIDDQDFVELKAPAGMLNEEGTRIDAYRVYVSRGWLMVSSRSFGTWSEPQPRLSVPYLNSQGNPAFASIVRFKENEDDAGAIRGFQHTHTELEGDSVSKIEGEYSRYWYFKRPDGSDGSAMIQPKVMRTREINVLPSIVGSLQQGHLARLDSNISEDGYGIGGSFDWLVERMNGDGQVIETFTETAIKFDRRFNQPGPYRATVTYQAEVGGQTFEISGSLEFEIKPAVPQVTAEVRTDPANRAKRFLALKFEQNTPSATFHLKIDWADDENGHSVIRNYTVTCQQIPPGIEPACDTRDWAPGMNPTNSNWSTEPVFELGERQQFRNSISISYSSNFQSEYERTDMSFANPDQGMPRYDEMVPLARMQVGTFSTVPVTEISVTEAVPGGMQPAYIEPFFEQISDRLPANLHPDLEPISPTRMRLVIKGTPQSDDIGVYTVPLPIEGYPQGIGLFPKPALMVLLIQPSTTPGYRALLYNLPDQLNFIRLREYPEMIVSVAHHGSDPDPAPFTGTVYCKLESFGVTVFEKPCEQDAPFPWPEEKLDGSLDASVWAEWSSHPTNSEPYKARVNTVHVHADLEIEKGSSDSRWSELILELRDHKFYTSFGWVDKPFSAGPDPYQVSCRFDDQADFRPCLDSGTERVLRSPGEHRVEVKVVAPDGHTIVQPLSWDIEFPQSGDLALSTPTRFVKPAASLALNGSGLLPGERYEVRFAGQRVAGGRATEAGELSETIKVPSNAAEGRAEIELIGQAPGRRGTTAVSVAPGKRLAVAVPTDIHHLGGRSLPVKLSGLLPGEPYQLRLAGQQTRGVADSAGRVNTKLSLPRLRRDQSVAVQALGLDQSRSGERRVSVLAPRKRLTVRLAKRKVRPRTKQVVKVRGLAPGEPLIARLGKRRISAKGTRANRRGVATLRFRVTRRAKRQVVTVRGLTATRSGRGAFRVVQRRP